MALYFDKQMTLDLEEYDAIAKQYNVTVEKAHQMIRIDYLAYDLTLRKASKFIRENCK